MYLAMYIWQIQIIWLVFTVHKISYPTQLDYEANSTYDSFITCIWTIEFHGMFSWKHISSASTTFDVDPEVRVTC